MTEWKVSKKDIGDGEVKCIICKWHSMMPVVNEIGGLMSELSCWGFEKLPTRVIKTASSNELKDLNAPNWCPLTFPGTVPPTK